MQISSTNTGLVTGSGLSVAQPTARRLAVELSGNAHADVSSTANARALQQIVPPVAPVNTSVNAANDADSSRMLARQREELDGLSGNGLLGNVPINKPGNEVAAQRAVAEYNNVAMQEQRFELNSVLAGVDVFA